MQQEAHRVVQACVADACAWHSSCTCRPVLALYRYICSANADSYMTCGRLPEAYKGEEADSTYHICC